MNKNEENLQFIFTVRYVKESFYSETLDNRKKFEPMQEAESTEDEGSKGK